MVPWALSAWPAPLRWGHPWRPPGGRDELLCVRRRPRPGARGHAWVHTAGSFEGLLTALGGTVPWPHGHSWDMPAAYGSAFPSASLPLLRTPSRLPHAQGGLGGAPHCRVRSVAPWRHFLTGDSPQLCFLGPHREDGHAADREWAGGEGNSRSGGSAVPSPSGPISEEQGHQPCPGVGVFSPHEEPVLCLGHPPLRRPAARLLCTRKRERTLSRASLPGRRRTTDEREGKMRSCPPTS